MSLFEPLHIINKRLEDRYGRDGEKPNYRIVYSEDQFEMRETAYDDKGVPLLFPEVRKLPKYRQWIQEKHVLERLTLVPSVNAKEIPVSALSYEPIFVFEDAKGRALPPAWPVAQLAIDSIHQAMRQAGVYTKYHDEFDGLNTKELLEKKAEKIDDIVKVMFANESEVGDALATENAISMAGLDGQAAVREEK